MTAQLGDMATAAALNLSRILDQEVERRIGPGPHDPERLAQRLIKVERAVTRNEERTAYFLDQEPIVETYWSGNGLQIRAINP